MEEKFKMIKDFPDYFVGDQGHIQNVKGEPIKPFVSGRNEYPQVSLYKDGEKHNINVHKLVADAFCPNEDPEKLTSIDHIDGDHTNAKAENLEWVTPSENNRRYQRRFMKKALERQHQDYKKQRENVKTVSKLILGYPNE